VETRPNVWWEEVEDASRGLKGMKNVRKTGERGQK